MRITKDLSFLTLLVCMYTTSLFSELYCEIKVPRHWEKIDDHSQLPKKICCALLGPTKSNFTPSINIAKEATPLSQIQYMQEAKRYHESLPNTRCTDLGNLKTLSGTALLMQIDKMTDWGLVRFLQAIQVKDQTAYVVTATCLESEFHLFQKTFNETIQTFEVKNDLK